MPDDVTPPFLPGADFAAARRPLADASTLPPPAYHAPEFFERELKMIFGRQWLFVGHAGRIAGPGAYFAVDLAKVPIMVVRGEDGAVRAFANHCRHRGVRLVNGEGTARHFVCPYHSWSYDAGGALRAAPGMEGAHCFEKADNGLIPVRLESLGPFLWVNFDADAAPLAEHLGDLPGRIRSHGLDDLVQVRRREYEVRCNWKVYVENFMDYYHTPTVHRHSLARGAVSAYHRRLPEFEVGRGRWLLLYGRHEGTAALLPGATGFPHLPGLDARAQAGSTYVHVSPNVLFGFTKDCVWYVQLNPTGPESIGLTVGSCFHGDTVRRADFDDVVQAYYQRWDVAVAEDNAIAEQQQLGIRSPLARAGRVSPMEAVSYEFRRQLLDALAL